MVTMARRKKAENSEKWMRDMEEKLPKCELHALAVVAVLVMALALITALALAYRLSGA